MPYVALRLPHRVGSGFWNMAMDRSLLDWVSQDPARLVFRTYGWERPTLSLGRREPYPQGWDTDALARAGVEVARRPTGGNAVLHMEEVTFALAASVPGPWGLSPRGFTNAAAEALARALARCGLEGATLEEAKGGRLQPEGPRPAPHDEPALCFARSAPGEVLVRGFKVAGLAARFDRGGALCHASIPLTARGRSLARFRLVPGGDAEALERNARSVGELIEGSGGDARALEARVGEALADALAVRFGVDWTEAPFEVVGVSCAVVAQILSRTGGSWHGGNREGEVVQ